MPFKLEDENAREVSVSISNKTIIRIVLAVIGLYLLYIAVRKADHALLLIFIAFILALALNEPVHFLATKLPGKRRGSRAIATTVSFLIVVIFLGLFLASIVPPLIRQTSAFINVAPKLINEFHNQNGSVGSFIRHYHLQKEVSQISSQLSDRLQHISGSAFTTAKQLVKSVFSLITILVLTFMMLVEGPRRANFFKELLPGKHHEMARRMSLDMYKVIKGFVNGQVGLALLASIAILPAVLILNISYPAAILVVVFICGLIPVIGHTIGAVIVTTVALFHSLTAAIIILIYYLIYMQIEAYLIQPKVQANTTNMSPLLVFASLVIGLSFGGLFGGLIAIPTAACLRIALLEYLYSQNIITAPKFKEITELDTK